MFLLVFFFHNVKTFWIYTGFSNNRYNSGGRIHELLEWMISERETLVKKIAGDYLPQ